MGLSVFSPLDESLRFRAPVPLVSQEGDQTVVWLSGEYDIATLKALTEGLSAAIALDDANLAVDLSEVLFIDAATIGVLIRARNFLRERSRDLTLRNPQRSVLRLLDVCGLAGFIDSSPAGAPHATVSSAPALRSWVSVRPADPTGASGRRSGPGFEDRLPLVTTEPSMAVDVPAV